MARDSNGALLNAAKTATGAAPARGASTELERTSTALGARSGPQFVRAAAPPTGACGKGALGGTVYQGSGDEKSEM